MNFEIPVYQPSLTGNEKTYVLDCVASSWISSKGCYVTKFENEFAEYINVQHAASTCNGTSALHLALAALGIGPNDEVLVPTLTFVASANAIAYTGATPIFVDCTPDTWQLDCGDLVKKISSRTKAIVPVHLYGHPCDMTEICRIAKQHGLLILEDCAEAFGSKYEGYHVGRFGDAAIFIFLAIKQSQPAKAVWLLQIVPRSMRKLFICGGKGKPIIGSIGTIPSVIITE